LDLFILASSFYGRILPEGKKPGMPEK